MKKCFFFFVSVLLMSCAKVYKWSAPVCDNTLYFEDFNVNPAGVDAGYLTDSINFRLYMGKWDNEHEYFNVTCDGDSVTIRKFSMGDSAGHWKPIETKKYSLKELKTTKKFE